MITSRHEEVFRVYTFPRAECDDDFDSEGPTVDEVSVEEVGVVLSGHTV